MVEVLERAPGAGIGLKIKNLENHLAFLILLSRTISLVFQDMEEVQVSTHHSEKTQGFVHREAL